MQVLAASPDEIDRQTQRLVGVPALVKVLESQGVMPGILLAGSGVSSLQLVEPEAKISRRQRLVIYRNAVRLSSTPQLGLLVGARHRLSDFGVYGYAFASCGTIRDAVAFSIRNMSLACPLFQIRYRPERDGVVLSSHGLAEFGDLLEFVAEFWRSSMLALVNRAADGKVRSQRMLFPYAPPAYWRNYSEVFDCPIEFNAGAMEWHLDEETLARSLPDANPANAGIFEAVCARLNEASTGGCSLVRRIRQICTDSVHMPAAPEMASMLNLSLRSLHRHLAADATSYQMIVDDVRKELSLKLLRDCEVPIDVIAQMVGFSEATNFSKAFRRWAGATPGEYRRLVGRAVH